MTSKEQRADARSGAETSANGHRWSTIVRVGALVGVAVLFAVLWFNFRNVLTLEAVARQEQALLEFRNANPVLVYGIAFAMYVAVTGLSLPGASPLTLTYGWFFGFWPALLLVSFASTTGATCAFLLSRYLLRDLVQRRFGERLRAFNDALEREGAFYLFSLRLIPAVPFFVINLVMGLTPMRVATFWWVSQLGMLAGTAVYVYAGSSIPSLHVLADATQLRPTDIAEPSALATRLVEQGETSPGASPIWENLTEPQRKVVRDVADKSITTSSQDAMAQLLNELINRSDFALQPGWQAALEARASNNNVEGQANEDVRRLHRRLLTLTFPEYVSEPQPLISWRLILAFTLLGVLPLALKKGLNLIRSSSTNSVSEEIYEPTAGIVVPDRVQET